MLIAIAHIVGALLVTLALSGVTLLINIKLRNKSALAEYQETATSLGLTVEDLEDQKNFSKALAAMSDRYSSDRLSNRLSDLCGSLQTVLDWIELLIQLGVFASVVWFTVTDSLENAIYAWCILSVGLIFWVERNLLAFLCRVLTGRFPGGAKLARKGLVDLTKQQRSLVSSQSIEHMSQY